MIYVLLALAIIGITLFFVLSSSLWWIGFSTFTLGVLGMLIYKMVTK